MPGAATETTAGSWAEPLDGPRAGPWPSPVEATAHPPGETATTLAADDPTAAAAVPGPAEPAPPESAELPADPTTATTALPASAMPPGAGTGPDTDQQDDPVADAREPGPMTAWAPEAAWPHLRKRRRSHALTATPSPAQDPSAAPGASPAEGPSPPDTDTPPMERPRGRRRKPEFMRQVERAAQWQRPAVRAVLGSTAAVLSMLLAGQMAWHWRDEGSARWPGLGRGLGRVCQTLGCELQAPRHLERLVLDSSQLSRTAWPGTLRLTLDLRNTADHAVRTPALDLRFTDANGQTLVRRVLLPAELGAAAPAAIEAQGLWHIDTGLNFGPLKVTGFSAEIFYP